MANDQTRGAGQHDDGDWRHRMLANATNWLTRGVPLELPPNFMFLPGNPHLFDARSLQQLPGTLTPAGVFFRLSDGKRELGISAPVFGAPMVSMYLEVHSRLGVRNVIACGYVGGAG